MTAFILMGVSGSGKTTIGRCVADSLGWPFIEGDDFHSSANKTKMASGTPLTDADRVPWITALVASINAAQAPIRSPHARRSLQPSGPNCKRGLLGPSSSSSSTARQQ